MSTGRSAPPVHTFSATTPFRRSTPRASVLVGALVRARVATRPFAAHVGVVAVLGALAGHTAATAGLAAVASSALVRNFEAYAAVAAILAGGLESLGRLGAPAGAYWLRPLFTRGLARAAFPLGVVLGTALAWAVLWTAAAAAYRIGGAAADVWNPAPALARLPAVWASVLASAAYGAACAAIMRSRAGALALAVAYPMACFLVAVRWVAAHPDADAPAALLRALFLLFPPLEARPSLAWALQYGAYGALVITVLLLLARRWVGREP